MRIPLHILISTTLPMVALSQVCVPDSGILFFIKDLQNTIVPILLIVVSIFTLIFVINCFIRRTTSSSQAKTKSAKQLAISFVLITVYILSWWILQYFTLMSNQNYSMIPPFYFIQVSFIILFIILLFLTPAYAIYRYYLNFTQRDTFSAIRKALIFSITLLFLVALANILIYYYEMSTC